MKKAKTRGLGLTDARGKVDQERVDIYYAILDAVEERAGHKVYFPTKRIREVDVILGWAMDKVQAQLGLFKAAGAPITPEILADVVQEAFARMEKADELQAHAENNMPKGAERATGRRSPMTLSFIRTGQDR